MFISNFRNIDVDTIRRRLANQNVAPKPAPKAPALASNLQAPRVAQAPAPKAAASLPNSPGATNSTPTPDEDIALRIVPASERSRDKLITPLPGESTLGLQLRHIEERRGTGIRSGIGFGDSLYKEVELKEFLPTPLGPNGEVTARGEIEDALILALRGVRHQADGRIVKRQGSKLNDSKAAVVEQEAVGSSQLNVELTQDAKQRGSASSDRIEAKTVVDSFQAGGGGDDRLLASEIQDLNQKGDEGNDHLSATTVSTVRQAGGTGDDILEVGEALDIDQNAGSGNDLVRTTGTRDGDRINIDLGKGNDRLEYTQTKGNDRVEIRGREGQDSLRFQMIEDGNPLILQTFKDGKLQTLFKHKVDDPRSPDISKVLIYDIENVEVLDPQGKPVKI